MKTHYDTLEVSRYATDEVIRRAHKVLVKRYHPDLQPDDKKEEAQKKMVEVNEAYSILSDKDKKAAYDRKLEEIDKAKEYNRNVYSNPYQNTGVSSSSNNYNKGNNESNSSDSNSSEIQRKGQGMSDEDEYLNNLRYNQYQAEMERQRVINQTVMDAQNEIYRQQAEIMNDMQEKYYDRLRSMGYTIREPFSMKEFMRKVIVISIILIVIFIVFRVSFIADMIENSFAGNDLILQLIRVLRRLVGGYNG